MEPIVDIREDGYYVGIWFLGGPGKDWMAVVDRDPDTKQFRMRSRFRYYADPDEDAGFNPFDADDTKRALTALCGDKTEAEVIAVIDGVVNELVSAGWCGTRLPWKVREYKHKDLVQGNGEKFKHVLLGLPYVHITTDKTAYDRKNK